MASNCGLFEQMVRSVYDHDGEHVIQRYLNLHILWTLKLVDMAGAGWVCNTFFDHLVIQFKGRGRARCTRLYISQWACTFWFYEVPKGSPPAIWFYEAVNAQETEIWRFVCRRTAESFRSWRAKHSLRRGQCKVSCRRLEAGWRRNAEFWLKHFDICYRLNII